MQRRGEKKESVLFFSHLLAGPLVCVGPWACAHNAHWIIPPRPQALQCQQLNKDESPFYQLILKLRPHTPKLQDRHLTIRPNQIISKQKENFINYWNEITKSQSELEFYLTLNRECTVAGYLSTTSDIN